MALEDVVGECRSCERPMLSDSARRQKVRREGHTYHAGRGLCRACRARVRRRSEPQTHGPVGPCLVCEVPMVSRYAAGRYGVPEGSRAHWGRGLCSTHWTRSPSGRVLRPREEVLEDYEIIREDCASVAEAAARMGMTEAALAKHIERARKAGIMVKPPPAQVERAILRGCAPPDYYSTRRSAA